MGREKLERYKEGDSVSAVKGRELILGVISDVLPELEYEIKIKDGSLRTVDHAHIIEVLRSDKDIVPKK